MKTVITVCTFILIAFNTIGQESVKSYVITDAAKVRDITKYEAAIEAADMDKYRLMDERRVITFQRGVIVELLSANELMELDLPVQIGKVRREPVGNYEPIFFLTNSGHIIEKHHSTEKKSY